MWWFLSAKSERLMERALLLYLFACASTVPLWLCVGGAGAVEDRINVILISGELPSYFLIIGLGY